MSVLRQLLSLLSSILIILLKRPNSDTVLCYSNEPFLTVYNCISLDLFPCTHIWITTAVGCDYLEAPENGHVVHSGTTIGSVVTYSCFPGYELIGETTQTCLESGEWTGNAPFCICKYIATICMKGSEA